MSRREFRHLPQFIRLDCIVFVPFQTYQYMIYCHIDIENEIDSLSVLLPFKVESHWMSLQFTHHPLGGGGGVFCLNYKVFTLVKYWENVSASRTTFSLFFVLFLISAFIYVLTYISLRRHWPEVNVVIEYVLCCVLPCRKGRVLVRPCQQ